MLNRVSRITAVVPTHYTHGDAVAERDLLAAAYDPALRLRNALSVRLQAGRETADHRRPRQLRPRWRVPAVVPMAVADEQQVELVAADHRIAYLGDRGQVDGVRGLGERVHVLREDGRRDEKALGNARDVTVHEDPLVPDLEIPVGDRHPRHLDGCRPRRRWPTRTRPDPLAAPSARVRRPAGSPPGYGGSSTFASVHFLNCKEPPWPTPS